MSKEIWQIKNGNNKIVYETTNKNKVADLSRYYNSKTKLPTQKFTLSEFTYTLFKKELIDINKQNVTSSLFALKEKCEHPFAIKHYDKKHKDYVNKKYELCKKLVYKYHYWGFAKRDGHKLCSFDF